MKTIRINSLLITLVEFDKIPFYKLLHASNAGELQNTYNFSNIEMKNNAQNQPVIVFLLGTFNNRNREILVKRLEIDERKIIIDVEGETTDAKDFFDSVTDCFAKISGEENFKLKTVVQSKESEIVSRLNFSASKLVEPRLLKFVKNKVSKAASQPQGDAIADFLTISFRIDYLLTDEKLKDYRIALSRKEFLIAPRDGTPLDEQIFVSKAPVDTDTHLKLLEELEAIYRS